MSARRKYKNYNTSVDKHELTKHFSATIVKVIFDSFKNHLDDLLTTSEAICQCHSGTFNSETGHCDPPETCEACYALSDIDYLQEWCDDFSLEIWFEDSAKLVDAPAIVDDTFDDFVATLKLSDVEYQALPVMVKHCLVAQFVNCIVDVENCLR